MFCINCNILDNLQKLRNLTPKALALVTRLNICLRATSDNSWDCKPNCQKRTCLHNTSPLRTVSLTLRERHFLREWNDTARYLSSHITPSNMHLTFLCDVADLDMTKAVVVPLYGLPKLEKCCIRLSLHHEPSLSLLSWKVSTHLTGQDALRSSPFRFLDLPYELRLYILEFTDLVTPFCEVEYSLSKKFHVRWCTILCTGEKTCNPLKHSICKLRICDTEDKGSYCLLENSAYSSSCYCWAPPTPLFLVCRSLTLIAQQIFFRLNRFVFVPPGWRWGIQQKELSHFPVSIFLKEGIPPSALQYLRRLEIALPAFQTDYLFPLESAYSHWTETLQHVKYMLSLPQLTIRVYVSVAGLILKPKSMTVQDGMFMQTQYKKFCDPLSRLDGLRRFYVHGVLPFPWVAKVHSVPCYLRDADQKFLPEKEAKMEAFVCNDEQGKKQKHLEYKIPQFISHLREDGAYGY